MDTAYLNALTKRRTELLKELNSIENILQLYPDEKPVESNEMSSNKRNTSNEQPTNKERIITIITDLGGQAYISQIVSGLKKQLPGKDEESINNIARNYVHMLKKAGRIKGKLMDKNKWLYSVV
jgi:hypothetical protein